MAAGEGRFHIPVSLGRSGGGTQPRRPTRDTWGRPAMRALHWDTRWSDPVISLRNSINYYSSVLAALGGTAAVHDSIRLFMVPGMYHCAGGDGTWNFDSLGALEQWVEQKKAPDRIAASRLTKGVVDRTRPLCPYPQTARYNGTGSTDDEASFVCRAR
jgi:feruloyl esterase